MIKYFHAYRLKFDGITIDLNEPTSLTVFPAQCKSKSPSGVSTLCVVKVSTLTFHPAAENRINNPPYKTRAVGKTLSDRSLCPDVRHWLGRHYHVHNLYGWSQSEPTMRALREATGKRGLVVSRSTFVGSGRWVAHWLGDNYST